MNRNHEDRPRALGKGLSALLPGRNPIRAELAVEPMSAPAPTHADAATLAKIVQIDLIDPNPLQPRTIFEPARLAELARSIEANGVIQPIIVQHQGDRYQLVAGERRLRAAKIAGLTQITVVIQEVASDKLLEIALVENIQREDLNPIEVAQALERLGTDLNLSHEEIGRRTGKDRTTVANLIRLLKLPNEIQLLLAEHRLSMGHARALLALPADAERIELANRAAAQGMSVRQVERQVQTMVGKREPNPALDELALLEKELRDMKRDPNLDAAIKNLEEVLGTRVRVVWEGRSKGHLQIEYYSLDDLDRVYQMLIGIGENKE